MLLIQQNRLGITVMNSNRVLLEEVMKKSFFVGNINARKYSTPGLSFLEVTVDGNPVKLLMDCGASVCVMKEKQVNRNRKMYHTNVKLTGVAGSIMVVGKISARVSFGSEVEIENEFYIVPDFECKVDGILGIDFLRKIRARLDFSRHTMSFEFNGLDREYELVGEINCINIPARCEKVYLVEWRYMIVSPINNKVPVRIITVTENAITLKNFTPIIADLHKFNLIKLSETEKHKNKRVREVLQEVNLNHLNTEEKREITNIIAKYADVFQLSEDKLGTCNVYKQQIHIKPGAVPSYSKPYRVPFEQREEIKKQISKMLEDNIIESAASPWSAPILIVPKKSAPGEPKKWRLVIDYRKVNLDIVDDKFPLPNITDIFDSLAGAIYFSHLDLAQGYYQLELNEESRKITAFSTPEGQYQMK